MSVLDPLAQANHLLYGTLVNAGSAYEQEAGQYQQPYGKRRYQFVLSRVLFYALEWKNQLTQEEERIVFYKDGTVSSQGVTNPMLLDLAAKEWSLDYNMAFWQIRRAALTIAQLDPAYSFCYDAGLANLLHFCAAD
jgi:hypothetical protein